MKTWEMIKNIYENKSKKFKTVHNIYHNVVGFNPRGYIDLLDDQGNFTNDVFSVRNTLDWDWEEVIEPVDFMTAYKDCLENKNTYCAYTHKDMVSMKNEEGKVLIFNNYGSVTFLSDLWILKNVEKNYVT